MRGRMVMAKRALLRRNPLWPVMAAILSAAPLAAFVAAPVPSVADLTSEVCRTREYDEEEATTSRCCTCGENDEEGSYCHGGAFRGVHYCSGETGYCYGSRPCYIPASSGRDDGRR